MPTLSPCPTCQRHVREAARCPFCGASIEGAHPAAIEPPRGVRRAVLFAATAALTAGATIDCGSSVESQPTSSTTDTSTGGKATTSTSTTASTTSSTTTTSTTTTASTTTTSGTGGATSSTNTSSGGGFLPPYGAPPV